MTTNNN